MVFISKSKIEKPIVPNRDPKITVSYLVIIMLLIMVDVVNLFCDKDN